MSKLESFLLQLEEFVIVTAQLEALLHTPVKES